MSYRIKLEAYTLRVRQSYRSDEYYNLDNIAGEDIIDLISDLRNDQNYNTKVSDQELVSVTFANCPFQREGRFLSLFPKGGKFGVGGDLVDIDTGEMVHEKGVNESDTRPYYIGLLSPTRDNKAIILFQKYGNSGIKTTVQRMIAEYLKKRHDEAVIIELSPCFSKEMAVRALRASPPKKVVFRKYHLASDFFNSYGIGTHGSETFSVELVLKVPRGRIKFRRSLENYIQNDGVKLIDIPNAPEYGIDNDSKCLVNLDVDGQNRLIDLSELSRFKPKYDVHDEIDFDSRNFPVFDSIRKYAQGLLDNTIRGSFETGPYV